MTTGLAALSAGITAGTLRRSDDGEIAAGSSHLLRPAYPEIGPVVDAAVSVVENARAIWRGAADLARATSAACKDAMEAITRDRDAAAPEVAHERKATRTALENQAAASQAELEMQRKGLEQKITLVQNLLDPIQPLLKWVIRGLSGPELPASMTAEGLGIAGEAVAVLGALRQDDPGLRDRRWWRAEWTACSIPRDGRRPDPGGSTNVPKPCWASCILAGVEGY